MSKVEIQRQARSFAKRMTGAGSPGAQTWPQTRAGWRGRPKIVGRVSGWEVVSRYEGPESMARQVIVTTDGEIVSANEAGNVAPLSSDEWSRVVQTIFVSSLESLLNQYRVT